MHTRLPTGFLLGVLSATLQPLSSQAPSMRSWDAPPTIVSHTAGLDWVEGEWVGIGDGYKVALRNDGFVFTPALGERAPRNYPIAFELVAIGRDGAAMPLAGAAPRRAGLRVEYDRGGVIERYDVGAGHLEQSFVFAERPAGRGDLVVRGRLSTELEVQRDGDGLRFTLPDVGGCTMSGVVGVDAAGRRVQGGVHYADGVVELSLPAAFVESAALPFVLDPLLGGASVVSGTGGFDDRNPTAAYDPGVDRFCVVWERVFSATDHDVVAQALTRTGVPINAALLIDATAANTTSPQIATCGSGGAFVVAFIRGIDLVGRAIDPATGALGATAVIGDSGGLRTETHSSPCLATDLTRGCTLCVWQRNTATPSTDHIVRAARVSVGSSLLLTVGATRDVVRGTTVSRPRLSKSDRGRDRHAVVFQRATFSGTLNAVMRVIDGNGVVLAPEQLLSSSPSVAPEPEVDGDGTTWVASWMPAPVVNEHLDVASAWLHPTTGQIVRNSRFAHFATGGNDAVTPRVTWITDSCLVGHVVAPTTGSVRFARVISLDPFYCTDCEDKADVGVATRVEGPPVGCAVRATGGTDEDVLLTWEQALAGNGDIIARRWVAVDGDVTSLGGGCGLGGRNAAGCPRSPNPFFSHWLLEAPLRVPAIFVLSIGQSSLPCGSCNLIPDLTTAITVITATDGSGRSFVPAGIPASSPLVGIPVFTQWATIDTSAPACPRFLLHLSDALRIVIR
ncbi:MAG: hypothetical protein R3F56_03010 [Planctomycetota bacterium]